MKAKKAQTTVSLTALEIAEIVNGELLGEADLQIDGVDSLDAAVPGKASFLGNVKYRQRVLPSQASVVLVPPDFEPPPPAGRAWVKCRHPSESFSFLIEHFALLPPTPPPGVHEQAVVAAGAVLPESVSVGPCAVIEDDVEIGENTVIGAGCYLGHGVVVGQDCHIYPNVAIREYSRIGDRVVIHCGSSIGGDGFGYIPGREGHNKIPQRGIVQIDDDVELGALVAVDRARFGRTWIKQGAKIDNLVQIAHNVVIGEYSFVVSQAGIAGSSKLGRHVIVAGQAGIAGHLEIGDGAMILGQSGVRKDLQPAARVFGSPAVPEKDFLRRQLNLTRLESMKKDLRELKKEVAELRKNLT